MPRVLLLDERIRSDGAHSCTWASCDGEIVRLRDDDDGEIGGLSVAAVDQVMRRYGRPLDERIALDGDTLACGIYTLRRLRHRAAVDADGRDYLVWELPGGEPLACVAATATAALRYLVGRRATVPRSSPSGI